MRIKAFVWVLVCAVLMMGLNTSARLAGDWLKDQASAAIYQQALGDVPEASALTLAELMHDPDYSARLQAANRQVSTEYAWYARFVFEGEKGTDLFREKGDRFVLLIRIT